MGGTISRKMRGKSTVVVSHRAATTTVRDSSAALSDGN